MSSDRRCADDRISVASGFVLYYPLPPVADRRKHSIADDGDLPCRCIPYLTVICDERVLFKMSVEYALFLWDLTLLSARSESENQLQLPLQINYPRSSSRGENCGV
ncbi:hypothetical protein HETIRDRAFT_173533 [Heterobasidion irregulare TC 32-1]|uniref:Uncharacterized protein n=1 Tax=Heterobasidion irregulare (strain TC 32-1) TaxID=747525 RepID=W4K9W8_HETIT|nr:uncharacterized protein HETIRDRAFT_173533 [Heterobasidion irregulare TC 32-1]ETW81851.1 hypothetical protein HETIRDRAFT_173533 [Heterobasidion irregulare TC 32-1]